MRSFSNIEELYYKDLKEALKDLESTREHVSAIYVFTYMVIVLSVLIGLVVLFNTNLFEDNLELGVFTFSIPSSLLFIYARREKKKYTNVFKQEIVTKLVQLLDSNWKYHYSGFIKESTFKKSMILNKAYDSYNGDDLIMGKIGKTQFSLCDLYLTKRQESEHGSNNVKVFRGLFAAIDFNKHLQSKTFVFPDKSEKTFGKFAQKLQRNSRGDLVKLENNEFEKRFKVFSTDQVEARYILTPTLMERLIEISNKLGNTLCLSFIDSSVYVLVSFKKGLFEPNVHTSGVNIDDVYKLWSQLNIINLIVNEMDLNTRIWTKD